MADDVGHVNDGGTSNPTRCAMAWSAEHRARAAASALGRGQMNKRAFRRALRYGFGRAILHLQQHDAAPYRDDILDGCLHDWTSLPTSIAGAPITCSRSFP